MDESNIKGIKLLELEDRKSTDDEATGYFRICVEGYDPSLRGDDLEIALRRHFSSCGTVMNIVIPTHFGSAFLNRSLIQIRGEDAEKKALELNGSNMGEWKLVVKQQLNPDLAVKPKTSSCRTNGSGWVDIKGYDNSLPQALIKRALVKHFASCGELCQIYIFETMCNASCFIKGEGAVEKALKLNGCGSECECDVIGCKFVAEKNIPRKTVRGRQSTGYTVPGMCLPKTKRAKV